MVAMSPTQDRPQMTSPATCFASRTRFDGSVGERLDGQQLSKWLGLYSHEEAPNMLTLTGIVAHILRHGRLAGRTEKSLTRTSFGTSIPR